jgi:hypothetical protein
MKKLITLILILISFNVSAQYKIIDNSFIVPVDKTWKIENVEFNDFNTPNSIKPDGFIITIYNDENNVVFEENIPYSKYENSILLLHRQPKIDYGKYYITSNIYYNNSKLDVIIDINYITINEKNKEKEKKKNDNGTLTFFLVIVLCLFLFSF